MRDIMTILVGWLSVDTHSPCSAYLLSDSRFTWGDAGGSSYDFGRKLFAFRKTPDILGYCGDVLFPSTVLSQITDLADNGLLFKDGETSSYRSRVIFSQIQKQFDKYPTVARNPASIYHFSRDLDDAFHSYKYVLDSNNQWQTEGIILNKQQSNLIFCDGSGAGNFKSLYVKYQKGNNSGTSRNIYQCFCDSLFNMQIPSCGGAPQLVGLFRGKKFQGLTFGIIYQQQRYCLGSPISFCDNSSIIRWYNENFEICNGETMQIQPSAMRQPNSNH